MLKDMGLAVEAAMSVGASIPLGEVARNLYSMNHQPAAASWILQRRAAHHQRKMTW